MTQSIDPQVLIRMYKKGYFPMAENSLKKTNISKKPKNIFKTVLKSFVRVSKTCKKKH